MNAIKKRLMLLEKISQAKHRKRNKLAKSITVHVNDNTAHILSADAFRIDALTPYDIICVVEDYIKHMKPESVNIALLLSGVSDLIPELAEHEAGRELDLYFIVGGASITGDYYSLLSKGARLADIILCDYLFMYFRQTLSHHKMGICFPSFSNVYSLQPETVYRFMCDYVAKAKAYQMAYETSPAQYRGEPSPIVPTNRWSRFWHGNKGGLHAKYIKTT